MLHIYIDADACPVKNEVYRVAERYRLKVTLVANARMRIPYDPRIALQVVGDNPDEADDWIAGQVEPGDIVVTADILLADRCIKKAAFAIGSTGKMFTEDNIGSAVALRDLMAQLRDAGTVTGGPLPFSPRDRSRFLQKLDEIIRKIRRSAPQEKGAQVN
ncbi:MAG: YaiI/YqxD family protein [Chitinispirillaceae bacterium]|nr:YaiI/YqxD family protein [Chitinispirillaceae bacterium]